jgi:hypothetical protein
MGYRREQYVSARVLAAAAHIQCSSKAAIIACVRAMIAITERTKNLIDELRDLSCNLLAASIKYLTLAESQIACSKAYMSSSLSVVL